VIARHHAGFTLAEILVVILVIALAAGITYAQFERDPRHALEREARRLAGALEHAALRAQWKSETLGVSAGEATYRFWRRNASGEMEQWVALSGDDVLAPRVLPAPLAVAPRAYAGQAVSAGAVLPIVPSGRNEPFVIELDSPEWQLLLTADPLNRVTIYGPFPR
jgi:general secretion pathway protein H